MNGDHKLSRRDMLKAGGLGAVAAGQPIAADATVVAAAPELILRINGKKKTVRADPRTTLLDLLRERLGVTGPKKGCDHGQCGACTVLIGSEPALACLTLAASVAAPVTTIEGLGAPERLHPMQQAFIDHDAFQCGYCTPGQIMSAVALARSAVPLDEATVREQMSGNLCRCAAYPNIVAAVIDGGTRMRKARL